MVIAPLKENRPGEDIAHLEVKAHRGERIGKAGSGMRSDFVHPVSFKIKKPVVRTTGLYD
jgi:hypothetical protein